MKVLSSLFCLLFLPLLTCAQQVEEGWRWKKTFVVQCGDCRYPVDEVHLKMSGKVESIQQTFKRLVESPNLVIEPMREFLRTRPLTHDVFTNLNADEETISDILGEDRSGRLSNYWLNGADFSTLEGQESPELQGKNQRIVRIICQNLQRLGARNIVIASLGTVNGSEYRTIPVTQSGSDKVLVFLSGRGNRLVELLEDKFFPDFSFVTFDKPYANGKSYEGFLLGNLGFVLAHDSSRLPQILRDKSTSYKHELDSYIAATKELQKVSRLYNECLEKLRLPPSLKAETLTEAALRNSQKALRDSLGLIVDLERKLQEIHAGYQVAKRLIPDFYHSEQLLRLFLYNNLDSLVPLSYVERFLTLHIHSSNDVCERCAHCLFLESEMCNVDTATSRPKSRKKGGVEEIDPYGFFEKFFNKVKTTKPDLKYQILASSSVVGERRGVQHRYQSGHDSYSLEAINLDTFPPLLAFKVIPDEFDLQLLAPSLTRSDSDAAASGRVLRQTYFPVLR